MCAAPRYEDRFSAPIVGHKADYRAVPARQNNPLPSEIGEGLLYFIEKV